MSGPDDDVLAGFDLTGRVALVTGASSGLGARAARVLDSLGATVAVSARRKDLLDDLARSLRAGTPIPADLSAPGAPTTLVERTVATHGRLDVLISCAGIHRGVPALRESIQQFTDLVGLDLVVPFELATAAARAMKAGDGGSIVNVATAAVFRRTPMAPQAGYAAAKGGLVALSAELAMQWGRYGIRVNALCPGMFRTEVTAGFMDSEQGQRFAGDIALRRFGSPGELDTALAFLATPASSYMTGQTLVIDGGWAI